MTQRDFPRFVTGAALIALLFTLALNLSPAQTARIEPHAWFVAYAPRENPQIAVVVMVENSREGSEVAAPIARRIIDAYLGEPYNNYPPWWQDPYEELSIPVGGTGGG